MPIADIKQAYKNSVSNNDRKFYYFLAVI